MAAGSRPAAAPIRFEASLQEPAYESAGPWTFLVLPKDASAQLPRRGRTTVEGRLNGIAFRQTLEPDGQLSHWLRVEEDLLKAAGAKPGSTVGIEMTPMAEEPDPEVPEDLAKALRENPEAAAGWAETTHIARLDWIHWATSAKQARTRAKRIADACDMLASGKRRVCCFDPSGFYSKAFTSPKAKEP